MDTPPAVPSIDTEQSKLYEHVELNAQRHMHTPASQCTRIPVCDVSELLPLCESFARMK